jgi:hypothetical protein
MRKSALLVLTWVTVAAAVLSAVWLSAFDADTGSALRPSSARPALGLPSSWPGLVR